MAAGEAIGRVPLLTRASWRQLSLYGGMALAVVLILVAAPRLFYAMSHVTTDDAYVDTYPAIVGARAPGTVLEVPVHEGQFVKRGQILAVLDSGTERSQVIEAQQAVAQSEADLAQALADQRSSAAHYDAESIRTSALGQQSSVRGSSIRTEAEGDAAAARAASFAVQTQRAALSTAIAAVPAARIRLLNAQKALRRMTSFQQQGYVSSAQLETAQNDVAQDQAAYQAALSGVVQARSSLSASIAEASAQSFKPIELRQSARAEDLGAQIAQSEQVDNSFDLVRLKKAAVQSQRARVAAAREKLRLDEHTLAQMTLRAPVNGYVAARPATIGQTLQLGDPAVIVMPVNDLFITANFKETQVDAIRRNASADIHIDAFPGVRFYGHVDLMGAAAQSALSIAPNSQIAGNFVKITQRVPVMVRIDRISGTLNQPLRPGMSAEVSVAH